ncbi:pyrroline-5-carboxylate reductase [Evansella sp. AB-P1]|uniref:pyrroline-5-carboxylate reductase n=1 Tax=Evansella sp. AB-P1 TaxID=3037653 RepID=UPI00241D1BAC|nr:pyrroline-5-carboxylate reductase [Evansella sp. AB-P1]MDG5787711.1 pyrroline-5-carboxylate reductase [Evansella sp. AB-P1]
MKQLQISFIGAGAMAEALISGWLKNNHLTGEQITVTNRSNDRRLNELKEFYGIQTTRSEKELIKEDTFIILACKPKDWKSAIQPYLSSFTKNTPIISVMAGVSTDAIEKEVEKEKIPVIRTMPNTSASVGASMTTIAFGKEVSSEIAKKVEGLFQGVGETAVIAEHQMDAATALTGSGPAYIYYLMEAMEMAAENMGIEPALAKKLVSQTLLGASIRVQDSDQQPAQLYKQIMSPGGTTEAGFQVLEANNVQQSLISCILRAWERSFELGELKDLKNPQELMNYNKR